jgi:hypothetical protein
MHFTTRACILSLACSAACLARDPPAEIAGAQIHMDFSRGGGFYSAPFPSEDLRKPEGGIDLTAFPNPTRVGYVDTLRSIVAGSADGFGVTSAIYFQMSGAPDRTRLPDAHASTRADSLVFLVGVDPSAPDYLRRYPVSAHYTDDGGPFGAPNLLALLPVQGIPLRPSTTYAAVVLRALGDASGRPLGVSLAMARLAAGLAPASLPAPALASYRSALEALGRAGIAPRDIAGMTVFRTWAPIRGMETMIAHVLSSPLPSPVQPFTPDEVFDDYCVYETTVKMPVYQRGQPPFFQGGGDWVLDPSGTPVQQGEEEARLYVTVPRRPMPAAGFPLVVFIRTGGGGDRPLVDRGVHAVPHGDAITPGTGPALYFARAGFAGASVDGPLGGLRNTTHADEQFLIFNIGNPIAMRDNIRQSAMELVLFAHILERVSVDASDCPGTTTPGGGPVTFDVETMGLMGHSMGATIAPLTLAFEPRYRAAILSGAGGSWIENVVYKESPLEVRPLAELLIGYSGRMLDEFDPALSLLQWGGEPSDPPAYAHRILREPAASAPRHVLMLQGIVDTYILPPMANATSLSFGLDHAGADLDAATAALSRFVPLGSLLDLVGRHTLAFPVHGNIGGATTAVVVQHPQDSVEDGHEVVFQTEPPKHQYQCFLESFAQGVPTVPAGAAADAPCNYATAASVDGSATSPASRSRSAAAESSIVPTR